MSNGWPDLSMYSLLKLSVLLRYLDCLSLVLLVHNTSSISLAEQAMFCRVGGTRDLGFPIFLGKHAVALSMQSFSAIHGLHCHGY